MSIRIMSTVWRLPLVSTHKIVLLKMADCANDVGASIYPGRARIAEECGISEKTVTRALAALERDGFISVVKFESKKKGESREYRINMEKISAAMEKHEKNSCDPVENLGDTESRSLTKKSNLGDSVSESGGLCVQNWGTQSPPNHHRTIIDPSEGSATDRAPDSIQEKNSLSGGLSESKKTAKKDKAIRGERLPEEWQPSEESISFCKQKRLSLQEAMDEFEKFRNYWLAETGARARKADWNAAFRVWILKSIEYRREKEARQNARF
jgi:DNA-binding MarR family transcriptional regulator